MFRRLVTNYISHYSWFSAVVLPAAVTASVEQSAQWFTTTESSDGACMSVVAYVDTVDSHIIKLFCNCCNEIFM